MKTAHSLYSDLDSATACRCELPETLGLRVMKATSVIYPSVLEIHSFHVCTRDGFCLVDLISHDRH